MAEWIEVPAHRIYAISERELRDDFDYIGENGRPVARGEIPYRFVRKKDGKVFKWARFAPQYCCASARNVKEVLPVAARALGLTIQPWEVRDADGLEKVFAALNKQRPDGLSVARAG